MIKKTKKPIRFNTAVCEFGSKNGDGKVVVYHKLSQNGLENMMAKWCYVHSDSVFETPELAAESLCTFMRKETGLKSMTRIQFVLKALVEANKIECIEIFMGGVPMLVRTNLSKGVIDTLHKEWMPIFEDQPHEKFYDYINEKYPNAIVFTPQGWSIVERMDEQKLIK